MEKDEALREIQEKVAAYYDTFLAKKQFIPGETKVPVSGKVFDDAELRNLVEASLDCWWTEGRFTEQASKELAEFLGVRYVSLCNSGSSANLLALTALTSPLMGERQLKPGDEVIGVAAGFPTTVTPIVQNGLVPVLVDIDFGTYNINVDQLKEAVTEKTKAIMIAHTLGNPWNINAVLEVAKEHNLWVIEDCCDALGSRYNGELVGTFGDVATLSFYPAHQMTCGEGGAVFTNNARIKRAAESFRDWGRDCWCMPGKSNTCGKRYLWQLGGLPKGYDHKYMYSHLGYNLKTTDLQGSLLLAQIKKLPTFIEKRKKNFARLHKHLSQYEGKLLLPEATEHSDPCWFGFLITVKEDAGFTRDALVAHLEKEQIATRMLFAGNIVKQPVFEHVHHRALDLSVTDAVMERTFWVGVWPGITDEMFQHMCDAFDRFMVQHG